MSTQEPNIRPLAPLLLLVFSAAEGLLSLFQWMELELVRAGGHSICNVNEVLNCEAVWASSFAHRIQSLTQLPAAGLGLMWGAIAFGLSALLVYRLLAKQDARTAVAGIRIASAVAVLSCITFGVASVRLGHLCLTCLGTYALVVAFALVGARGLPGALLPHGRELRAGLGWAAGLGLAAYLVLLGPGMATGAAEESSVAKLEPARPQPTGTSGDSPLDQFLASLPPQEQQQVSMSLAVYKHSPMPPVTAFPTRFRSGPADAPVRIVDFTDIRCPHCRQLDEALKEIHRAAPEGSFSVEPRAYPLDGECNAAVAFTDGTHVRCTAAKALICLESHPDYWSVRERLFSEQETLSVSRVMEVASSGSVGREELQKCIDSPEALEHLKQDEAYASEYHLDGTPLVLVNGHRATAVPAFLYAMVLTRGNADAPAFARLAPRGSGAEP
jgi:protein-disulfide isomerase